MWASKLEEGQSAETMLLITMNQWSEEERRHLEKTERFALDRQALIAFKSRIAKGLKGVVALGESRECRIDLTQVKGYQEAKG